MHAAGSLRFQMLKSCSSILPGCNRDSLKKKKFHGLHHQSAYFTYIEAGGTKAALKKQRGKPVTRSYYELLKAAVTKEISVDAAVVAICHNWTHIKRRT